uniref:Uncharacterized protein n=1 Tax=Haplochromis burtoni TaxID=8153 RepID=A0A3Q2VVU4_HAPBU
MPHLTAVCTQTQMLLIYDIWVCYQLSFNRYCQQGWTRLSGRCAWSEVVGYTGNWKPQSQNQEGWGDRFYSQRDFRIPQNLVTLSLGKWTAPPTGIANSVVYFTLGVDVVGEDPYGVVKVNFRNSLQGLFPTPAPLFENFTGIMEVDYTKLKPRRHVWLDWLIQNSREQNVSDCVACAAARPNLFTEPAPLYSEDHWGLSACLDSLGRWFRRATARLKQITPVLTLLFLNLPATSMTPARFLGNTSREKDTWRVQLGKPGTAQLTARCRCHVLKKRSTSSFDRSIGSPTYIDCIGAPRGVPDHYKLANPIAAGFENLPLIAGIIPITPNKNVDCINYVHYNILRLANLTHDVVGGFAEQLRPTSLMTVQNRMALDMLLAEKGGTCAVFGDMCCTFIPNNTAPDGSVTRALGLKTLSNTMHEHLGVNNPLGEWMTSVFGQWKSFIMSILVSLSTLTAILVTCGCCCVPCLRTLLVRVINQAVGGSDAEADKGYVHTAGLNAQFRFFDQIRFFCLLVHTTNKM